MTDDVAALSKILLDPVKDEEGKRKEAAAKLASYLLEPKAFNALYSICCYPDLFAKEENLVSAAGSAIGKILATRDQDPHPMRHLELEGKFFEEFHPEALQAALRELNSEQLRKVYRYTMQRPHCSEALSAYFHLWTVGHALEMYKKRENTALDYAASASLLFKRVDSRSHSLDFYFIHIVMAIIAGEVSLAIFPLFIYLIRNYQDFDSPATEYEKYRHLHIILLAKLVTSEYSQIQVLLQQLKQWIGSNKKEDEPLAATLEMIIRGDASTAFRMLDAVGERKDVEEKEEAFKDFYTCWLIVCRWLVKNRI